MGKMINKIDKLSYLHSDNLIYINEYTNIEINI